MTHDLKVEMKRSAFFWVFLGPLSALSSVSLFYVKAPHDFHLILLATSLGLLLTWVGRAKGLGLSLALLALVSAIPFLQSSLPSYWIVGAVFSVALSFFLTFLTLEEAENKAFIWHEEIKSNLDSVKDADEKISVLEKKLLHAEKEYNSLEQIQELSRIELLSALAQQKKLEEELTKLTHGKRKLEEEFEDQTRRLEGGRKLIEKLQTDVALNREMSDHIDTLTREKDLLESTLSHLQAELEEKQQSEKQLEELKKEWATLQEKSTAVANPPLEAPSGADSEYRKLLGVYRQLRDQFTDKSAVLDETRRELFLAQERSAVYEKEIGELESRESASWRELSCELELLHQKYEDSKAEIRSLEEFISNLVSKEA